MGVALTKDEILELEPEEILRLKLWDIPPTDMVIMSLGAWLGYNGYTPVTAMINLAKGLTDTAPRSLVDIAFIGILSGPIGIILSTLLQPPPATPVTDKEKLARNLINAGVGAIESYALTRPGVVTGLAQAIGEILPL
jgi:hypothetical protein